jgi:hypothetical protein
MTILEKYNIKFSIGRDKFKIKFKSCGRINEKDDTFGLV